MLSPLSVKSVEKDFERRWYSDDYFDLIVWHEKDGTVHGFQLCYDTQYNERALTWTRHHGFRHTGIDSGEASPYANQTPILVSDGRFPAAAVRKEFIARGAELPPEIYELVLARIDECEKQFGG